MANLIDTPHNRLHAARDAFDAADASWQAALIAQYGPRRSMRDYPRGGRGDFGTMVEATYGFRELARQALGTAYDAVLSRRAA